MKLPAWFTVDTPIGPYNPDWAIVFEDSERVYLVRETKGAVDPDELRGREETKIRCARRHFDAIGVDYAVTSSVDDMISGLPLECSRSREEAWRRSGWLVPKSGGDRSNIIWEGHRGGLGEYVSARLLPGAEARGKRIGRIDPGGSRLAPRRGLGGWALACCPRSIGVRGTVPVEVDRNASGS